jgi:hypothetical protein
MRRSQFGARIKKNSGVGAKLLNGSGAGAKNYEKHSFASRLSVT